MTRQVCTFGMALALLGLSMATAFAAAVVFDGTAADSQLGPWGNGAIKLDSATKFSGSPSLEVQTRGYGEGGRLVLTSPVSLSTYLAAPAASFVVVKLKLGAAAAAAGPAAPGGGLPGLGGRTRGGGAPGAPGAPGGGMPGMPAAGGGMPGMPRGDAGDALGGDHWAQVPGLPGMPAGGGTPGGMPGMPAGGATPGGMPGMPAGGGMGMPGGGMMGMPGGGMGMPGGGMMGMEGGMAPGAPGGMPGMGLPGLGGPGGGAAAPRPPKPLKSVRVVLVTDKGQLDLGAFDVNSLKKDGDWYEVRVAFKDLKLPAGDKPTKLQAVVFTGNSVGAFSVGRVELVGG